MRSREQRSSQLRRLSASRTKLRRQRLRSRLPKRRKLPLRTNLWKSPKRRQKLQKKSNLPKETSSLRSLRRLPIVRHPEGQGVAQAQSRPLAQPDLNPSLAEACREAFAQEAAAHAQDLPELDLSDPVQEDPWPAPDARTEDHQSEDLWYRRERVCYRGIRV